MCTGMKQGMEQGIKLVIEQGVKRGMVMIVGMLVDVENNQL